MKVTTKIKNLKDHIIGYFNRDEITIDDKLKDVLSKITPTKTSAYGGLYINYSTSDSVSLYDVNPKVQLCYSKPATSNTTQNITIWATEKFTIYFILHPKVGDYTGTTLQIIKPGGNYFRKDIFVPAKEGETHLLKLQLDCSNLESIILKDLGKIGTAYQL